MCKKILSIVLTLMMMLSAVSVNVWADETAAASGTVMVAGGGDLSNLSKNDTYSSMSSDVTFISGKSLRLTGDGTTSGSASSESKRWTFGESYDWTSYKYINIMAKNASETDSTFRLALGIDGSNASAAKGFWYKDNLTASGDGWMLISAELSTFKQGYKDGEITEGGIYDVMSQIQGIFFDGINGELYVDSIWISKEAPAAPVCTLTSVENESADVLMDTTEYTFNYSEILADASVQSRTSVETTEAGFDFASDYEVTYNENQLKITFAEMLKPNTDYSISVSGVLDCFGLEAEPVSLNFRTSETVIFPDEIVLADFSVKADIDSSELSVDSENKLFSEKSATLGDKRLASSPSTLPIALDGVTFPNDWSSYTHFNIWVYSEEATADRQFALVLRSSNDASSNTAVYFVNQDFEGWRKLNIPLSSFTKGKNFDITLMQDCYISFVYGKLKAESGDVAAWDIEKYKKVSFAKMWISTESTDGCTELYNSDSSSATKNIFNKANYAELSVGVTENNNQALKLTGTGEDACESKNPTFDAMNWTDYTYLNFRIKNGNEAGEDGSIADASFYFYATVSGSAASAATGYWRKMNITVSGSEWQIVSIAIPNDFSFVKNNSTEVIYTEMSNIEGLRFDYINGTIYVEKIWLSEKDCRTAPALRSVSVDDNETVSAFTRKIDFNYSELLSSDAPEVTIAPEAEFVVDTEGSTVSVIFPEGLESGKDYTVTVGADVKSVFGISAGEGASVSFSAESYSAGRSDSAVFASFTSDDASGKMFIVVYDAEKNIESIAFVGADATDGVLNLRNDYVALDADHTAKIFVWEGTSLKPIADPVNFN